MARTDFRTIANARIAGRIRQVVVLILTIVAGILISVSVQA